MAIFKNDEERATLLTTLRFLGATKVVVRFSGSGDSGSIDQPYGTGANGEEIDLTGNLDWNVPNQVFNSSNMTWTTQHKLSRQKPLHEILKTVAEQALEESGIDWYNNDGGQGELTIDFETTPPTIELEVGQNETITHDHTFDFSNKEGTCTRVTTD